jgi:hypothetical protein
MLDSLPIAAVLAFGGLLAALVVVCGVGLVVLTVVAIWKMRSDDFWDKTET